MEQLAYAGMGMAGIVLVLLAVKAGYIAMALWYELSRPRLAERVHEIYVSRGLLALVVGTVNAFFLFLITVSLLDHEPLALLGLLSLAGCAALSVAAYAAAYRNLALRLGDGKADLPTRLRAALLMEAAFLVPVFGQALSAYTLLRGLGALTLALLALKKESRANQGVARE